MGIVTNRRGRHAKKPLISYRAWIAIKGRLRELPIEEQVGDSRWSLREERSTEESWEWLKGLGFYPEQRPVHPSTEEPGLAKLGQEIESLPGTDLEEGEIERDINLLDKEKEPKPNTSEWNRLKTCERPRTKEEWRSTTRNKWRTMESLGLLWKTEEKGTEEEQKIPVPPKEERSLPPPTPPSKFLKDKPRGDRKLRSIDEGSTEVGVEKGKGEKQKGPKGQEDTKGKRKLQRRAEEAVGRCRESSYTNQTSYEEDRGLVEYNQKWEETTTPMIGFK